MKARTNLPQGKITKILKLLEERGLVKAIKSIQNASRKVYMLSSLEPAKEITGGPWYGNDQQPDKEFIETIRSVVSSFVERSGPVTLESVSNFIQHSGVSSQPLQQEDVASILKTLCYDVVLEKIIVPHEGKNVEKYRKTTMVIASRTPFTSVPCGVCPVFSECHEGGAISPEQCQYYTKWFSQLDF
jgi:DNA-directed RNA polymerase III subunit RPC6